MRAEPFDRLREALVEVRARVVPLRRAEGMPSIGSGHILAVVFSAFELVTQSSNSDQVMRIGWIWLDLGTEPLDVDI
jgi:hypothetical protein